MAAEPDATDAVAPAAAGAPAAGLSADGDEKGRWPPPEEQLEKWMMNTVKEGDSGARFLRTMLQMNPAYGTYLQTDDDLINVVQMFSKRIKTKVSQYENPANIPPQLLTQPLCEMVWRVVGYVMHSVIELEEEANMPVPKEASGMVRMLLKTNTHLSNKLNDLRRVYLKELAEHRDKQRRISKTAQSAVDNLKEQPIMFFEPLEFVLDETTKDFVREAVVERIKLEMRTAAMSSDENAEMAQYLEELEREVERLKAEVKQVRASNNRLEEQLKTVMAREEKLRADLSLLSGDGEEAKNKMDELEALVKKLQDEMSAKDRKIEHLETKLGEAPTVVTETREVMVAPDNSEEMEALSAKVVELQAEVARLTAENAAQQKKWDDMMASGNADAAKDAENRRMLSSALAVEKELRAANESLEKALAESEKENTDLRQQLEDLMANRGKTPEAKEKGPKGISKSEMQEKIDAAIEKALKKMKQEHEDQIKQMQKQIEKLTHKLETAEEKCKEMESELEAKTGVKQKVVKQVGVPEEEHEKLKAKCHELETKLDEMEDEYAKLEQKVAMLMDKLKDKFSDAEIAEIVDKIKLAPPPIRKKRKKKAYERLYDDAQRRILEMKLRQEKLREIEEKSIKNMARIVKSSRDARKVEMIGHLHKANQQTSQRFHDALINFQTGHARSGGLGEIEEDESDDEGTMRRIDRLTDLEELTMQCFKDGVCPRCAFSALATFRKSLPSSPTAGASALVRSNSSGFGNPGSFGAGVPVPGGRPPNRSASPPPWDIFPHPGTPQGRSASPSAVEQRALGSPLAAGPSPGAMPFDAAFPMPAPPWRQPAQETVPPWRQDAAMSSSTPSFASTGPPVAKGAGGFGESPAGATFPGVAKVAAGFGESPAGATFPNGAFLMDAPAAANLPAQVNWSGAENINAIPPWRRDRSNSPTRVDSRSPSPGQVPIAVQQSIGGQAPRELAPVQPPIGAPPPKQAAMAATPPYGRLGRSPGEARLPPQLPAPVPGRVPAAQTVSLDPIVRNVGSDKDASPSLRGVKSGSSPRSHSPEIARGKKQPASLDGFRKMRTAPTGIGSQFEADLGRPNSVPTVFGKPPRSSDETSQPMHREANNADGHPSHLGGGGMGTAYRNLSSTELPSVPSTRSMPTLPVGGGTARAPWNTQEVPWESSAAAKKLAQKAPKKPGPGFVVTPLVSQEGLRNSRDAGAYPPR